MVASQVSSEVPYIDIQDLEQQAYCDPLHTNLAEIWSSLGVHGMADETFHRGYNQGAYLDPSHQSMSNMQRFLEENETYYAGRHVNDVKQPYFNGENLSPTAGGYYGAPNSWPHGLDISHGVHQQPSWNREWTASDPESCSATTGNTWSPRATESCPDQDPQYPSWSEPHVYPGGSIYPEYGSNFAHGAGVSSPQSVTGALSEIQQCPDNEAEFVSMKEEQHVPYRASSSHLGAGTAKTHRDEGLGSSVNESAIASPVSMDDHVALESVSGDGHDSDYSPQNRSKRNSKNQKARTKSQSKDSVPPTTKRSSMSKVDPHQLTTPAKVTKRTSSTSKPNLPSNQSTSFHTSQIPSPNDSICTHCFSTFPSTSTLQKHVLSSHTRPFVCSFRRYGCTSRFGSKNEWKRHVSSQHLCPGIYRCDIDACVPHPTSYPKYHNSHHSNGQQQSTEYSPNDFNRKDLFTQHLRRMHRPGPSASRLAKEAFDGTLENVRLRCWIPLRDTPPKSICPYCAPHPSRASPPTNSTPSTQQTFKPVLFEGKGSWDERMEHVGKHLEKDGDPGVEVEDVELREWMVREKLIGWERGRWIVAGVGGRRRGRGGGVVKEEVEAIERDVDGEGEEDADGDDE